MTTRNIIEIDREKCIGCGQCAATCHQGAIAMIDGKAQLVRSDYCDGLGRCLGECPADAIRIIEVDEPRAAAPTLAVVGAASHDHAGGCPGHQAMQFHRATPASDLSTTDTPSELTGWPIQLHLVRPDSPMFHDADVLIAASCSAFACGAFHSQLLRGKTLVIACPKLDRQEGYLEKLSQMFAVSRPKSVTIARMEVPCCQGLTRLVAAAREASGVNTPVREVVIGLQGEIVNERETAGVLG